jgi:hypothetical protein
MRHYLFRGRFVGLFDQVDQVGWAKFSQRLETIGSYFDHWVCIVFEESILIVNTACQ